ncbi:MAG TPA: hypothetical protein VJ898_05025 [Natrialbaceae archaeon]|nr:hypothetical protein [Natrialbaceae archaeon]
MTDDPSRIRGRAQVTLGLSLLFAVAVFLYFGLGGAPVRGAVVGVLVVVAGVWEYRRRLQDERVAMRFEMEAEEQQQRKRK